MLNKFSNSLSQKSDNNRNNNSNNNKNDLAKHHSSNSLSSGTGVMRMNDASFGNDPFCGFDDNVKLSSGHKSVTSVNESSQLGQQPSLGAVRSLSDPNANASSNNNSNTFFDDDLETAQFSERGSNHKGVAVAMPMPAMSGGFGSMSMGGGMQSMQSMQMPSMDDFDDLPGMGAALSLSTMSLSSFSSGKSQQHQQQRGIGMPMGMGNELKSVPVKGGLTLQAQQQTRKAPAKVSVAPEMPMGFAVTE